MRPAHWGVTPLCRYLVQKRVHVLWLTLEVTESLLVARRGLHMLHLAVAVKSPNA